MSIPLFAVNNLSVRYPVKQQLFGRSQAYTTAVEAISFELKAGHTLGIVGESGSGKTTVAKACIRLNQLHSGSILYKGISINQLSDTDYLPYRKKIQMIFQDPIHALNPNRTLYETLKEPLDLYFSKLTQLQKKKRIEQLLYQVGLSPEYQNRYPHAISGGQRQRIAIARALAVEPEILICDESVSALDVIIQAQILELLKGLQIDLNLSYIFIGHDVAVVHAMSHDIAVMHQGRIVEYGSADHICHNSQHPYTQALIAAVLDF